MARQESGAYSYYSGYAPTEAPGSDPGADPVSPSESPKHLTAAATPKRARVEAPRRPSPVPVHGSSVYRPAADHSAPNGAEPPSVRRATPVGS